MSAPRDSTAAERRSAWQLDQPREHRSRPCARCPWRRDVDLSAFTAADMAKLEGADGTPGAEASWNAPTMACHRDQPGTAHAMRLCAGWLAVVGHHHLAIRMAVMAGGLPPHTTTADPGWPKLYPDFATLRAAWERCRAATDTAAEADPPA